MRSFIAVMMLFALSSAPCFELFSAAPVNRISLSEGKQNRVIGKDVSRPVKFYADSNMLKFGVIMM